MVVFDHARSELEILTVPEDPGPEGRTKVCALVQDVLQDEAFVATHLGAAAGLGLGFQFVGDAQAQE